MLPTPDPVMLVEHIYAPTEDTLPVSFRTVLNVPVRIIITVLEAPGAKSGVALAARQSEATHEVEESSSARLARASKRERLIHDIDYERGCRTLVQILYRLDAKELSLEPVALRLQLRWQHLVEASSVAQLHQRIEAYLPLGRPCLSRDMVHVVHRFAADGRAAQDTLLVVAAQFD